MTHPFSDSPFFRQQLYIGGKWSDALSGKTLAVEDPATGTILGSIPNGGTEETRLAIEAAHTAFKSFSQTTAAERADMLRLLHQLILDNKEVLAQILTAEQGKPLSEARGEVGMSAAYVLWFAEEARRTYGEIIPSPWQGRRIMATRQPVGVVGAITPWNFPSSMLARKIAPAIAAGCTMVCKPATQTPYSGLAWAELCEQAGIPAGVVNVVTGSAREIGAELTANPKVQKITFTGSTDVGKVLLTQAAQTVKKVSMELGGNAPFIVFDDADLDRAVEGAIASKFRNAGQTCVCTNRIYVQSGIYDRFIDKLTTATAALQIGRGTEAGTEIGPLVDGNSVDKVDELLADAVAKGGRVVAGGKRHALGANFFEPTVIADATSDMRFAREEIFGPLAPVFRFETEQGAIDLANDTEFGLACYFYTKDLGRAFRVSEALEYGIVGVNEGLVTTEVAPFGGFKESGMGREGSLHGIADYLEIKYVCMGGLNAAS
ncbi:NAD-dependent succinate-semialdehyde dehydrogenase [Devosia sp. WQ 349]|uniref:NAD-dependent succinate-semialdehyde dehydrogenase n=1 Tax=Devosia sp. WQ 349K1 TaxID=2800329 RepID=UPI0019030662|nr:NAD-dependent succinate-semialdehyde dehydrogenase [Devosia sp. WQ 349K1]